MQPWIKKMKLHHQKLEIKLRDVIIHDSYYYFTLQNIMGKRGHLFKAEWAHLLKMGPPPPHERSLSDGVLDLWLSAFWVNVNYTTAFSLSLALSSLMFFFISVSNYIKFGSVSRNGIFILCQDFHFLGFSFEFAYS